MTTPLRGAIISADRYAQMLASPNRKEIFMTLWIIAVECLAAAVPFTAMVVTLLNKNPVNMITDYPPEIQAEYYRSQGLEAHREKLSAKNYIAKGVFLLAALAVIVGMAHLAGARTFLEGALAALCYALAIFAFDTFIIDRIFFPRVKRWRLPGTEHMDREYAQKWFHVKACFPMIPVFVVMAALVGLIIMWI